MVGEAFDFLSKRGSIHCLQEFPKNFREQQSGAN